MTRSRRNRIVTSLVSVVALTLAAAAVVLARQEGPSAVSWFSQRMVALPGHPIRMHPHYDLAPGPLVVWFVRDEFNRATCLAIVTNQGTGQVYGPTTVDPKSCAMAGP